MILKGLNKTTNWRQPLAGVALIGIGVLIALWVDGLWEERQERKSEIEYLQSLQNDFQSNREELIRKRKVEQEIISIGVKLHAHLESCFQAISPTDLNDLISRFYWLDEWEPITGTYDEMLASGRLLFLRNKTLRDMLSQYSSNLNGIRAAERIEYTSLYTEQLPFLHQHIVLSQLGWIDDYRPRSRYEHDIEALCSKQFHNLISSWMTAHSDVIRVYDYAIERRDEILKIIDLELQSE